MENRGRRHGVYRKILVAYDGSPGARRALMAAIELADQSDAELHCISVEEKLPYYAATLGEVEEAKAERDAYFEKLVQEARRMAWDHGIELHSKVVPGHEVGAACFAVSVDAVAALLHLAPDHVEDSLIV